jgi:hypothetical protein
LTRRLAALAALLVVAFPVGAVDADAPLRVRNLAPAAIVYGLPAPQGVILAPGERGLALHIEHANNFTARNRDGVEVFFDGSTTVASVAFRQGLRERWEWGVEVPLVDHSGGFTDRFIDNFHDLFGFPDGGRSGAPRNRLQYRIAVDGETLLDIERRRRGLGDLRIWGGYRLMETLRSRGRGRRHHGGGRGAACGPGGAADPAVRGGRLRLRHLEPFHQADPRRLALSRHGRLRPGPRGRPRAQEPARHGAAPHRAALDAGARGFAARLLEAAHRHRPLRAPRRGGGQERHRNLYGSALAAAEPLLDTRIVPWACLYREYHTDDARLVLATLRAAAADGAIVCNHVRVEAILRTDRGCEIVVRDGREGGSTASPHRWW